MRTRRYRNRRIGDFLKELHLIEGRNTGIPTAIKAIKENGSPLPQLLTDEERSYFSVIVPIHDAFTEKTMPATMIPKRRRSRDEIKKLIIQMLDEEELSATELYRSLGYSGNISKTFSECIEDLIELDKIEYTSENRNASDNKLRRI